MQGRILDLSLKPLKLRIRDRQVKLFDEDVLLETIPIDDIAVVLLSHPQISISLATMQGLCEAGASVVFCDDRSLPLGLCLPVSAHHASGHKTRKQAEALSDRVLMKKLWRQIVRHKIKNQAELLREAFQTDHGLLELYQFVKSGDTDNREGVAAKRYWSKLFDDFQFHRDQNGTDPANASLNYGYSIVRAIVARAIVAAGLSPALGIFHHNKYNPYALADDLMEPFRPVVDRCVYLSLRDGSLQEGFNVNMKTKLIRQITGRYVVDGQRENFFETAGKAAESLARIFEGEATEITFPTKLPLEEVNGKNPPIKESASTTKKKKKNDDDKTQSRPF